MMQPYEDPDAARDLGLSVIEAEIERLPRPLGHYRDRAADIAEKLYQRACEHSTCESQAHSNSAGPGGKAPSQATTPRSTKWTLKPGSTPSASSDTAIGPKARSCRPASGGNPKPTPKPANSSRPKSAAPRSTASSSTRGEHGHG